MTNTDAVKAVALAYPWENEAIKLGWASPEAVKKPTHQHVKTKKRYVVLCPSAEIATSKNELIDGEEVTIYQGEDGYVWVHSKEEFEDGRFVVLAGEKP